MGYHPSIHNQVTCALVNHVYVHRRHRIYCLVASSAHMTGTVSPQWSVKALDQQIIHCLEKGMALEIYNALGVLQERVFHVKYCDYRRNGHDSKIQKVEVPYLHSATFPAGSLACCQVVFHCNFPCQSCLSSSPQNDQFRAEKPSNRREYPQGHTLHRACSFPVYFHMLHHFFPLGSGSALHPVQNNLQASVALKMFFQKSLLLQSHPTAVRLKFRGRKTYLAPADR